MDMKGSTLVEDTINGGIASYWEQVLNWYGLPLAHYIVNVLHNVYINFTILNLVLFIIKTIPSVFTYFFYAKFVKNMYYTSRDKLKQKRIEMEDIHLQIEIVNQKLRCRVAEHTERENKLKYCIEELHMVRAQVRQFIADNLGLRQKLKRLPTDIFNLQSNNNFDEETKLIEEFIKGMKYERTEPKPEKVPSETKDYVRKTQNNKTSDVDENLHIKIVQVTNVYDVEFLEHIIKQKKQQQAQKEETLKRQMNKTKKILNDWYKALNKAIGSTFGVQQNADSEEAMGDRNKDYIPEGALDSDSDMHNSLDNSYEDDHIIDVHPHPTFINFGYDDTVTESDMIIEDDITFNDNRCTDLNRLRSECNLYKLPEETNSEIEGEKNI